MSGCCGPRGYEEVFSDKSARGDAVKYRRKGLDTTARRIVDWLVAQDVSDATVLEIGGGVGAIQIELLRAGAARATNVEIVGTYEEAARDLLREHSLEDRVERLIFDFAADGDVGPADIVVMHQVICCYPDMARLVSAAATHAGRYLALTFPPDRWWWHLFALQYNFWERINARCFRGYVHDTKAILATARAAGLRPVLERKGLIWQIAILERAVGARPPVTPPLS
jgi:magnesium-protoporphyrin O-methyltransferase